MNGAWIELGQRCVSEKDGKSETNRDRQAGQSQRKAADLKKTERRERIKTGWIDSCRSASQSIPN